MQRWLSWSYLQLIGWLVVPWVVSDYLFGFTDSVSHQSSSFNPSRYRDIQTTFYSESGVLQYRMVADQLTVSSDQKLHATRPSVVFGISGQKIETSRDSKSQTMRVSALSARLINDVLHFEKQVTMSLLTCAQDTVSDCAEDLELRSKQLDYVPNQQYFVAQGDVVMTQRRQTISARRISGYLHHQDFAFDHAVMTTLKQPAISTRS